LAFRDHHGAKFTLAGALLAAVCLGATPGFALAAAPAGATATATLTPTGAAKPSATILRAAAPPAPATAALRGDVDLLRPADEAHYRAAFAAAEAGRTETLSQILPRIEDGTLKPHVERVRLLSPAATPDVPAMAAWLDRWGDVAGAGEVFTRALGAAQAARDAAAAKGEEIETVRLRRPAPAPVRRSMGAIREPSFIPVPIGPGATAEHRARIDVLAARFYAGDDDVAFALASLETEGPQSGHAGWIGGLAAFRSGEFATARRMFMLTANWSAGDDWTRSAGAFWAARAAERAGEAEAVRGHLEQAASTPLTFYGQLALMRLGRWDTLRVPTVQDETEQAARLLRTDPGVRRAVALVETGRRGDAAAELQGAWSRGAAGDDLGFLAIASRLGLNEVVERIRQTSPAASLAALYPVPENVRPRGGAFTLDRALVFAVMRQESKFDPNAVSYAGARGLMQVMPSTAAWMTGRSELRANPRLLHDPALSVSLGEQYLEKMLAEGVIAGNLTRTIMAYNAGPGSVGRWVGSVKGGDDPLMFMEAAPSGQARVYAERVMANLWIYHRRFGQRAPSLEKLARGLSPTYEPQDDPRMAVAALPGPLAGFTPVSLRGALAVN
jgi:soluble lytic murein transglycosylase-like protein